MLQEFPSSQEHDQFSQRPNGTFDMDKDMDTYHHIQLPLSRQSSSDLMIQKDPVKAEPKTKRKVSIDRDGQAHDDDCDHKDANGLMVSYVRVIIIVCAFKVAGPWTWIWITAKKIRYLVVTTTTTVKIYSLQSFTRAESVKLTQNDARVCVLT